MEWGKELDKKSSKVITENDFSKVEEKKFKLLTKNEFPFVIIGLLLIVMIAGFISVIPMIREQGSSGSSEIDKKISELNEKLKKFKEIEEKITKFEKSMITLKNMDSKIDTVDANLTLRISKLSESIEDIKKQYVLIKRKVGAKKKTPVIVKKKPVEKKVAKKNELPKYYRVKKGDTFYSISRKYKISLVQLQKLNNFTEKSKLYPNMKIKIRE